MLRTLRSVLVSLTVATASLTGCQSGDPAVEPVFPADGHSPTAGVSVLDLPVGKVEVLEVERVADAVRIEVTAAALGRRAVDLRAWSIDDARGLSVTVRDPEGRMTWDMSFEGDGTTFRTTEAAGDADLAVERHRLGGGRWSETYELSENGRLDILELSYDENDAEDRARAFREFRDFWPAGTVLDNNDEALLAASIVTSPDIVSRTAADLGVLDPLHTSSAGLGGKKIPEPFEQICLIANACTMLKCALGGPFNHLCDVCASIGMACVFLELLCSLGLC